MATIEDLIVRYGLITKRRFYEGEKNRFLYAIASEFNNLGYHARIQKFKVGQFKAKSLYIGDFSKAETIMTTYYDTPTKSFGLHSHKVVTKKKKSFLVYLAMFLPLVLTVLLATLFVTLIGIPVWYDGFFSLHSLGVSLVTLIFIRFLMKYKRGMPNKFNFVRNTSSIISLLAFANELDKSNNQKVAFILTDFGCVSNTSDGMIKSFLGNQAKNKKIVKLDCVGSEDDLMLLATTNFKKQLPKSNEELLKKIRPIEDFTSSNNIGFNKTLLITSGVLKNDEIVVKNVNCKKDFLINFENIEKTVKFLKKAM